MPDVCLRRAEGGAVSPADFVGHELIVLFPPSDVGAARLELRDYSRHLGDLDDLDAWLLAVYDQEGDEPANGVSVVHDVDGTAWKAMTNCAGAHVSLSRDQGAAFVFGRGGSLQNVFCGAGHASEVFDQLHRRR